MILNKIPELDATSPTVLTACVPHPSVQAPRVYLLSHYSLFPTRRRSDPGGSSRLMILLFSRPTSHRVEAPVPTWPPHPLPQPGFLYCSTCSASSHRGFLTIPRIQWACSGFRAFLIYCSPCQEPSSSRIACGSPVLGKTTTAVTAGPALPTPPFQPDVCLEQSSSNNTRF